MRKGIPSARRSALVTAISTAAVSGSAAVAGAILAREFGHGVKTDGFFVAYGLYLALVLVAQSLRVVVLPAFARAREDGRLGGEVGGWALALALPLAPLVAVCVAAPGWVGGLLSGGSGREQTAELLPWLVVAAALQILAGLAASALAALDDYDTAAFAFALGAVAGIAAIVALLDHGVVAFGWGLALNGAVAAALPLGALAARGALGPPERAGAGRRLRELAEGVTLPFALQGLFVVGQRFAGGLGEGDATTFGYAYLIAAFLVAVTASSIALISSVPLTRGGLEEGRAARHVVSASWLSLSVVAAAAGVFALAGETLARRVLGGAYGGGTGSELGRLVVYLAPWMVASVGVSVTFPLLFVRGRGRRLPLLALAALLVHVGLTWAGSELFGLPGIAAAMAVTTAAVLVALLAALGSLAAVGRGLTVAALVCGGLAAAAFVPSGALLAAIPAAVLGLAAYTLVLWLWRPAGLRAAWAYARALN